MHLTEKAKAESQGIVLKVAPQIFLLVKLEMERESRQRRHVLETLYQRLGTHATRLGLSCPPLSTFYSPDEYRQNAQAVLSAVQATLQTPTADERPPAAPKPRRPLTARA